MFSNTFFIHDEKTIAFQAFSVLPGLSIGCFITLLLIMLLCTKCLYTSFRAILVYRSLCPSNCFSSCCRAPEACIQASGRFWLLVLCAYKAVSHHAVGHQMLAYKVLGDSSLPFLVFIKLFIIMLLCTKCLYTSFRGILVEHHLCSSNCLSSCCCAPNACIQASDALEEHLSELGKV